MRDNTMLKSAISHHLMGVGRTNLFRAGLKLRLGLILLLGAGLFVACEKDPVGEEIPIIPEVPVVFSSGLSDWRASRAANGSLSEGDQVGIYMIPHVAEASAVANFSSTYADSVSNVPYLTSGSGESVTLAVASGQKAIVFPADGSQVNFVAYSPYKAGTNTANANVYKVDVSTQSPAKAIDLLYHKGTGTAYSKTNTNVGLAFTHQLSKLKISLVSASGTEADLIETTLRGFPSTADFNLSTGVLSNLGGTDAPITLVKAADSSVDRAVFEAIVVPHAENSYTRSVTFKINNTNYGGCLLPASVAFKAGAVHSYNFRFTGTKVEPAQELIPFDDGGMVSWGDYQLTVGKLSFDNLLATRTTGHTVKISTNAPAALTYALSNNADTNTDDKPEWITGVSLSEPTPEGNGWNSYVLTFGTDYHINSEAASRTGYIRLEVAGITLPVRVNQAAAGYDIREPEPASFADLIISGKTGNTFTITTNAQDEEIAVTTTNTSLITNLTKTRSEVAADGSSTWTIGFDVAANKTIAPRSGDIEVILGGIKKTVTVSQVGVSVSEPSQTSFSDLAVGGLAGNTFTLETNALDESITATRKALWITVQDKLRSEVAADGTSTWTVVFDVSANTTTSVRTGSIDVTIGGIKKTVTVSQAGISVGELSRTSFIDLPVGGLAGNTFTITTNTADETITVNTPAWITKQTPSRSALAEDGTFTWTIVFDVAVNTTTDARSGNIEVTIGGQKKTIPVSQVAMYVNAPVPANIPNVNAAGAMGKTFTIETNSTAVVLTSLIATDDSMITNLKPGRSVKDAANGSSIWTISFDVTANTTTSVRTGSIEVTIGGIKKTLPVLQAGISVGELSQTSFLDLPVAGATGKTFTITTNTADKTITVNAPAWITKQTPSRSAVAEDGTSTWTINFDVAANTTTSARSGSIDVTIGGIKQTVTVSQVGVSIYVNTPSPESFSDLAVIGERDKTFTIATNAPDENITVTTTNTLMITNLISSRDAGITNGSYIWTISFDVTPNTMTLARTGSVEVAIGGQKKTVSVSQVAMYVNTPNPANISNVIAAGETGKMFTVETNAPDGEIAATSKATWITNLAPSRSVVAADGTFTWTIVFDVVENTTTLPRSGNIEVTIGGIKKTVTVSQIAMYVNEPTPASIENVVAAGETGKTFTIETNSTTVAPPLITVTDESMITNLNVGRSVKDVANGIYLWTVAFDVSTNTTISGRRSSIEVTIGGQMRTITVSQVAMYVNAPVPVSFENVVAAGETVKTFTIETNSAAVVPTSLEATDESIIKELRAERSVKDVANGIYLWTVTFNVSANTTTSDRSASIAINIGGITKTVNVSQNAWVAIAQYVNAPIPANIENVIAAGATKTFTIETNVPDEEIATTTGASWITNLSAERSVTYAASGIIYLWTVTFNAEENIATGARTGNIEVTIGGITKTVSVSQIGVYVNAPIPASIENVAAAGATGQTFTLETNSTAIVQNSLTTTDYSMITSLNAERSVKDVVNGIYLWTVTFNVSANTTVLTRFADVSINIDGVTKTISVSQVSPSMYVNEPTPTSFIDLPVKAIYGRTFTIETNFPAEEISVATTNTLMITNLTPSRGPVAAANGSSTWTINFNVSANTTTSARSGSIEVTIGGIKKTVTVSQVGVYVNTPNPASIDVAVGGATGKTFTIATNVPDNDITVNFPAWITTTYTKSRGPVDEVDGSSTWTIGFNVPANTTASARSGNIEVTIGGIKKTIPVLQAGLPMYVNMPSPDSFPDLPVGGATGKTFTIETNAPDESISMMATNTLMITNLTPSRGPVAAADGSFTWTIRFDVTPNPTEISRTGNIEVTIGGQKRIVSLSQRSLDVNPSKTSFSSPAAGATGNMFIITTNDSNENIAVTTTNPSLITNLTKTRSAESADGPFIWTIRFDVTANTTTSARSGNIEVTIGNITKTINVVQAGMYVTPNPASINITSNGEYTFIIETNLPGEIEVIETASWIMGLSFNRTGQDTVNGIYRWMVTFHVAAESSPFGRSTNIVIRIGGIERATVPVTQN